METIQYRKFQANKLVRDKTVERLGKKGIVAPSRQLLSDEYNRELKLKLVEEAQEVLQATAQNELLDELADVMEVVRAICASHGVTLEDVEGVRQQAYAARGGFDNRIYISNFELAADNPHIEHYTSQPEKYPEVL